MITNRVDCRKNENWLKIALEGVRLIGYAVVENVLDEELLSQTRAEMYAVQRHILGDVGEERLKRAGELGVLRLMLRYSSHFFRFLELPELLAVVDATVSPTAILHLQNGFILPSFAAGDTPGVFQNKFHQDFPRVLNGYLASLNVMFAIDEFASNNGATLVVPGAHQRHEQPDETYMRDHATAVQCSAGSMVLFDSTLWHAAGRNASGRDRLAINHQFTRSFIKQQID